ncbi:cation diffusion facilitator family transporter [soil metagenome]
MSHEHHDHDHSHAPPDKLTKAFAIGMVLNVAFVVLGIVAGIKAGSTALLADAAHNLGDVLGLGMAWGALVLAKRAATARRTYGLRRTTILATLANGGLVLFAIGGVVWEAIQRIGDTHPVNGGIVAVVAAIGVVLNGVSAMLFAKGREKDMNQRGAFLHLVADAAVSAGVVVAGLIVWKTGWVWIDPVTSIIVSVVILRGTWKLVSEAFNLLMDAVPEHVDPAAVEKFLRELPGVREVHDLHVWSMSTTEVALTAHLVLPWPTAQPAFLATIHHDLEHHLGIHHITLQFEDCTTVDCAQASPGSL